MKKFYSIVLITLGFLCMAGFARAQFTGGVYETLPLDPTTTCTTPCSLFDENNWIGGLAGQPPVHCSNCQIIIHGNASLDITGLIVDNNSQIIVSANTTLSVDARVVVKDNTQILIGSDATSPAHLVMTAEADLFTNSYVQLANGSTDIDATALVSNSDDSLAALAPYFLGPGIYYITGPTTFNVLISGSGFGDPTLPPDPGHPTGYFFSPYFINCIPPNCLDGIVNGPATSWYSSDSLIYKFSASAVLPVTLVQFAASVSPDKTIRLSWATAQETNSDYFELQRSADGNNFQPIGKVKAKGFSSITTNYSYTDANPLNSVNYYRLKMVDQDAKYEFSKVITVTLDGKTVPLVVYNNPFTDQIRIKLNTSASDNLSLVLTDVQGKTYLRQSYKAQSGDNFINIYPPAAASGLYILSIKGSRVSQTIKLLKQ